MMKRMETRVYVRCNSPNPCFKNEAEMKCCNFGSSLNCDGACRSIKTLKKCLCACHIDTVVFHRPSIRDAWRSTAHQTVASFEDSRTENLKNKRHTRKKREVSAAMPDVTFSVQPNLSVPHRNFLAPACLRPTWTPPS